MEAADLQKAIKSEFTCYYQLDELPATWADQALRTELPQRAWASALRLRRVVGPASLPALAALLLEMRNDPSHPLVQRIGSSTMMMWSDEPEDWRVFQQLIDQIIGNLQADSAPVG